MILLDTHTLIWLVENDPQLGSAARQHIAEAEKQQAVAVSAISFWEIALLLRKQRLTLVSTAANWRDIALKLGVVELPLLGSIAITAAALDLHPDPADRFIVATALAQTATLLTADEKILGWQGPLLRQDARL